MIFNLADIQSSFEQDIIDSANLLLQNGSVENARVNKGGEIVTAVIKSSEPRPFRVYIRVEKLAHELSFHGECSCKVRINCQHVAAVLLNSISSAFPSLNKNPKKVSGNDIKSVNTSCTSLGTLPKGQSTNNATVVKQDNNSQQLIYIILLDKKNHSILIKSGVVRLNEILNTKTKFAGTNNTDVKQIKHFEPSFVTRPTPVRFLKPDDIEILTLLNNLPRDQLTGFPQLTTNTSSQLFEKLLTTQRCYYPQDDKIIIEYPLKITESRDLQMNWEMNKHAIQHLQWRINPTADLIFLSEPWFLDCENKQCGKVTTYNPINQSLPYALVQECVEATPILPDQDYHQQNWERKFADIKIPGLKTIIMKTRSDCKSVPCLHLKSIKNEKDEKTKDVVCFNIDYCGHGFRENSSDYLFDGKHVYKVKRDRKTEERFVTQLESYGLHKLPQDLIEEYDCYSFDQEQCHFTKWFDFQIETIPLLEKQGWSIHIDKNFGLNAIKTDVFHCSIENNQNHDWFDLGIGVEVDGERVDIIPALIELLHMFPSGLPNETECPKNFVLPLDSGRLLRISSQRLRTIFNTLLQIFESGELNDHGLITVKQQKIVQLAALENNNSHLFEFEANNPVSKILDEFNNIEAMSEVAPPAELKATLRNYQQSGINWLQFLRKNNFAGILADDMGLGKTLQILAHILVEKVQGRLNNPAMIVMPTSLLFNWRQEAQRFTPTLKVVTLHGPQRHQLFKSINHYDIVLTTYPLLYRDEGELIKNLYHFLILDEAQNIKNTNTKASHTIRNLNANHRICLTGTPMENHLGELWSLFDFLMPGYLGKQKTFQRIFRNPIEKQADEDVSDQLSKLIRPFMMRRTKERVAPELPEKTEMTLNVVLEGQQRELYESVRLAMHDHVKQEIKRLGIGRSYIMVMSALLKLRQICCDPGLLDLKKESQDFKDYNGGSAKLELLMNLLTEMIEEGRRILLFSQFTTMLSLIENELLNANIPYLSLTGKTKNREDIVSQFQEKTVPLLLISLKAGGVGLNLTEADTVIHFDPWWNPAVEQQATARAHRIGQKKPVFIYKLICQDTVEEKIQKMQLFKQSVVDSLYDNKGGSDANLSLQDIEELFSTE